MNYQIVTAEDVGSLAAAVNAAIAEGWAGWCPS